MRVELLANSMTNCVQTFTRILNTTGRYELTTKSNPFKKEAKVSVAARLRDNFKTGDLFLIAHRPIEIKVKFNSTLSKQQMTKGGQSSL